MSNLSSDLAGPTRKRQDEAEELGRSAGKHAGDRVAQHLKQKHCLTDDEQEAFDKGFQQGRKSG